MKLYTELSAHEKFKRTLRSMPFCLIIMAILLFVGETDIFSIIGAVIVFILFAYQLIYTYIKSRKE